MNQQAAVLSQKRKLCQAVSVGGYLIGSHTAIANEVHVSADDGFTGAQVGDPHDGVGVVGDSVDAEVGALHPRGERSVLPVIVAALFGADDDDHVAGVFEFGDEVEGDRGELVFFAVGVDRSLCEHWPRWVPVLSVFGQSPPVVLVGDPVGFGVDLVDLEQQAVVVDRGHVEAAVVDDRVERDELAAHTEQCRWRVADIDRAGDIFAERLSIDVGEVRVDGDVVGGAALGEALDGDLASADADPGTR